MAALTDITWQQLEAASGLSFISSDSSGLIIRLQPLTGSNSTNKNSPGVVQALFKLREFAAIAQVSANQGKVIGERLASFPPSSSGTAVDGYVIQAGQIIAKNPLSNTGLGGVNN
ncbi:MAG: hypothetical protein N3E45_17100 [Oscillatoriaceae bacterium SKW80]|nr:hypothetical protein [Oscillatoriaceae bacterium SKW80]HIK27977.1 hypothetical protein [Oscillatoriaceae cyanobacterium M7585_C2015_266]